MSLTENSGIEDLYRSIIQDVIEQSKEAFLDENIDTDILFQIQKSWEDKINASGAVDLNPKVQPVPTSRPPQAKQQPGSRPGSSASKMPPQENSVPSTSEARTTAQYATPTDLPIFRNAANGAVQLQGLQYLPSNVGQFVVSGSSTNLPPSVMMIPVQLNNGVVQMQADQFTQLPQNDGEGLTLSQAEVASSFVSAFAGSEANAKTSEKRGGRAKPKIGLKPKNLSIAIEFQAKEKLKPSRVKIPQCDGGGPHHMSDSDDSEDEDEDHMSQLVNNINNDREGEDEGTGDEEPLNSADDQSDDEDLDTLFESSNIMVCQFEKVNRARNKWKFTLKDGILHLKGKDACFQKCTGEAEW